MRRTHLVSLSLTGALLIAACSSMPTAVGPRSSTSKSTANHVTDTSAPPTSSQAPASGTPSSTPASQTPASQKPASPSPPPQSYFGLLLDEAGNPAANVKIAGYLISNNGGGLVSNNGSGLISNNGGALVSDKGTSYHVLDAGLTTTTDAQGHFTLVDPQGRALNLVAIPAATDQGAIAFNVASNANGVTMHLAPLGTISGKVESTDKSVTNFLGVPVYVPGTSYQGSSTADGSFNISGVPAGTYALYATQEGLGSAIASGVKVDPGQTASATLELAVSKPTITSVTPGAAGSGATVTLKGFNFGASKGTIFSVTCGGATVSTVTRVDDNTITFTVPVGANSNDVFVTVGGIQSTPATISILSKITISTPLKVMLLGQTLQATLKATDANKKPVTVTPDEIAWTSSDPSVLTVDTNGLIKAVGQGLAQITASNSTPLKINAYATGPLVTTESTLDNADVSSIGGLAYDPQGRLVMSDDTAFVVDRLEASGTTTPLYDNEDGQSFVTGFGSLAVDGTGNTYVCDVSNNRILKIAADRTSSILAGPADADFSGSANGPSGSADQQGSAARFDKPYDIACDAAGNVYVADSQNNCLRKITSDGTTSTFASGLAKPVGLGTDAQGNLYVACAGDNTIRKVTLGGQVSLIATNSVDPSPVRDVAVDAQGTVYVICEPIGNFNTSVTLPSVSRVYRVDNSSLTAIAGNAFGLVDGAGTSGGFGLLSSIVVGPDGNLVVGDNGDPNNDNGELREIILH